MTYAGWVPIGARVEEGQLVVDLCRLDDRPLVEPFFDDSIAACMRLPFHALFRRRASAAELGAWLRPRPAVAPAGFVFHMSRCGSTLLSQVLAAVPAHRVLSEAPPIDAALRGGGSTDAPFDEATRAEWLRVLLTAMTQPPPTESWRLFGKFDSWHAQFMPLILRAFPGVPWVFLIRDPVQVLVSHMRRPGAQMVPGMVGFQRLGADPEPGSGATREIYAARTLGAICQAAEQALALPASRGIVVDYSDFPDAIESVILPHFDVAVSARDRPAVEAALRRDAKNPWFDFSPDLDAKRADATPAIQAAADGWALPTYRRLRGPG